MKRSRVLVLTLVAVLTVALACGPALARNHAGPGAGGSLPAAKSAVVLYFARLVGQETYLVPVTRTVEGGDSFTLVYRAMGELIKGPTAGERAAGLMPVLPASAKIRAFGIGGTAATVDLSREVITRASAELAISGRTEALALGSIANTLTEFDGIKTVYLLVEGKQAGAIDGRRIEDFWGHIGLPRYLTRNETLIWRPVTPPSPPPLPEYERQTVGQPAEGLVLEDIRWSVSRARTRIVWELRGQDGRHAAVIPYTEAEYFRRAGAIRLTLHGIRGVSTDKLRPGRSVWLGDGPAFSLAWQKYGDDQALSFLVSVNSDDEYVFKLSALAQLARIVLEVEPAQPAGLPLRFEPVGKNPARYPPPSATWTGPYPADLAFQVVTARRAAPDRLGPVDFATHFAVCAGATSTNAAQTLNILRVEQRGQQVTVTVKLTNSGVGATVMGYMYHDIKIARADLARGGQLRFVFQDEAGKQLASMWAQVAR